MIGVFIPFLFWIYFLYKQFESIKKYHWEISLTSFLWSIVFSSLYFITFSFNWSIILKNISIRKSNDISVVKSMRAWLFTIMSRYVPGNVWHILGRMTFSDELNTGKTEIFTSSAIEQLVSLVGATFVFFVSFPFWPLKIIGEGWIAKVGIIYVLFFSGLLILHPIFLRPVIRWLGEKLKRPEIQWNLNYSEIIHFTLLYCISFLIMGLALIVLLKGFGQIVLPNFVYVIGCSAIAWVIGYISFITPSGLGVREGTLAALLALMYPMPVAIVASLLFRIVCTIGELIAILLFVIFLKLNKGSFFKKI